MSTRSHTSHPGIPPADVHDYYRQVTEVDIGEMARELLGGRITQENADKLLCDCPNHRSQSHRSLIVKLDTQSFYCFGCAVGGDVLQFVEFAKYGTVTRGQHGPMPHSHRHARDFLATRVGIPPLSQVGRSPAEIEEAEREHRLTVRVHQVLTALAGIYHESLMRNSEVLAWFQRKYGIGTEMIAHLKIGFAGNETGCAEQLLADTSTGCTEKELLAASAFRLFNGGVVPFFDRRIVFPYWRRGSVVFMIGRQTPWTPDHPWEKPKYKKLSVRGEQNKEVAQCIQNDCLFNEDLLLSHPDRVIITEGITDGISLIEHGFPAISPVTVQIRDADWERLLPKLAGVKTVYICQDNEASQVGLHSALRTAQILSLHKIATRIAVLPLSEKQEDARRQLREQFGIDSSVGQKGLRKCLEGRSTEDLQRAEALLADSKIDVNEYFATGHTAGDFEVILASSKTALELNISYLSPETAESTLGDLLEPILGEVKQLMPLDQERHLRLIQSQVGKDRLSIATLRRQLKLTPTLSVEKGFSPSRNFNRAEAREENPSALLTIQANDRQLRVVVGDAWSAIHKANSNGNNLFGHVPFLYQRCGRLVRLAPGKRGLEIKEMNESEVIGLLTRTADWVKTSRDGFIEISPTRDVAVDMLAYPDARLPIIDGVIYTPVFGRTGQLLVVEGYHCHDRVWLQSQLTLQLGDVPSNPTPEDITVAVQSLLEMIVDFPFVNDSDRAHALGAMILPFARRLFEGPTPNHLFEAPMPGSGKGLLVNVICILPTGNPCEARTLPERDEEIRKMITAELRRGLPVILLDNADDRSQLHSPALASVLTSVEWTDRILGVSGMASLPNQAMWLTTANNPNLHIELARRCVRIRLDARDERPWNRKQFKHPDLVQWTKDNRERLVKAILTLISAWIAAGKPEHTKVLGSFDSWARVIGGILNVAGIKGFLDDLEQFYEAANADIPMWQEFISVWWESFQNKPKKVSELNWLCEQENLMLQARGDGTAKSREIKLGIALQRCRDRVFDGFRIVKESGDTKHKGATVYSLEDRQPQRGDLVTRGDGPVSGDLLGMFPVLHPQ